MRPRRFLPCDFLCLAGLCREHFGSSYESVPSGRCDLSRKSAACCDSSLPEHTHDTSNQKLRRSRTLYPSPAILAASHNRLQEAAEPTFLDWFLFSHVDEAVISVGSNFGFTAAMRRLQTPVTVWHSCSALLAWRLCISGGGHASGGATDLRVQRAAL